MVTYVHCGDAFLPAKITFEGVSADAPYYDEGLGRDVSFAGKRRIGLMSDYEKNVGVTPFSHALFERAMQIGRERRGPGEIYNATEFSNQAPDIWDQFWQRVEGAGQSVGAGDSSLFDFGSEFVSASGQALGQVAGAIDDSLP